MNEASIAMQVQAEVIVSLRTERSQLLAKVQELQQTVDELRAALSEQEREEMDA